MKTPLEVEFRNMDRSPALEARARELAASLEKFGPEIIRCNVTVEIPHRHQHQGRLYAASLRITVPGREIAISRGHAADHAHENAYVALHDAFRAAQRCLQDYERERRGDVKTHIEAPHGRICEVDLERRFGRIETDDGRLIYFHGNSVLGRGFEELDVGHSVRFVEERGDLGPQASTVYA